MDESQDIREQAWQARRDGLSRKQAVEWLGADSAPVVEDVYNRLVLPEEAITIGHEVREIFKQVQAEAAESSRILDEWSERKAREKTQARRPVPTNDPMVVWVTDTLSRVVGGATQRLKSRIKGRR